MVSSSIPTAITSKKRGRPKKIIVAKPEQPIITDTTKHFHKGEKGKIVGSLLKETAQVNWAIEFGTFAYLFRHYPNPDFWRKFSLPFKLNSLLWLKGEGKGNLERAYWVFQLDFKPKDYIIEGKEKIGEDYKSQAKPSLKDILKS